MTWSELSTAQRRTLTVYADRDAPEIDYTWYPLSQRVADEFVRKGILVVTRERPECWAITEAGRALYRTRPRR